MLKALYQVNKLLLLLVEAESPGDDKALYLWSLHMISPKCIGYSMEGGFHGLVGVDLHLQQHQ